MDPIAHHELWTIVLRLLLALLAGSLVGYERTFHGRPAGLRTHALVCTASGLLMLLAGFQWQFVPEGFMQTIRVDPTRMAQGIMTGIGFLGAGVIVKEGLTVRGLTTAASIWMTASIGIIIGLGFYPAAAVATIIALGVLSAFQWIEKSVPSLSYFRLDVSFLSPEVMPEDRLFELLREHGFSGVSFGYRQEAHGRMFRYEFTIRTGDKRNVRRLAETLNRLEAVHEFSIIPTGD